MDDLKSKIELFIECKNLPNLDTFSKSDPLVVVSIKDEQKGSYFEIGRTEVVNNDLNPKFNKRFELDYFFEENQELKFDVYDADSKSSNLKDHDIIGQVNMIVGELVASPGCVLKSPIKNKGKNVKKAVLIARVEELSSNNDLIKIVLRGEGLDKKDLFGKSDPYLEFYRYREDGEAVQIHKTEVVKKTLNPSWKQFVLPIRKLCNGDMMRQILIKCYDWDKNSADDLIGEFKFSLNDIIEEKTRSFDLINEKIQKKKKKKYKNSGVIKFDKCEIIKQYTFIDYIKGGLNISLQIAIDFTGSNGDPAQPSSLHYRYGNQMNDYQKAIMTVGSVVSPYDSDGKYAVWGYGGKLLANNQISHCFPLTFDVNNQEVEGVQGILDAYNSAFDHVKLSGPTYFSPVLSISEVLSSDFKQTNTYNILLILTDGIINDMAKTIDRVVSSSDKPMSILIVGIGGADFSAMDKLDGDDGGLRDSKGRLAKRDIVQFVEFSKFKNSHISVLAKEALAEVPPAVLSFMKLHNIQPNVQRDAPPGF